MTERLHKIKVVLARHIYAIYFGLEGQSDR